MQVTFRIAQPSDAERLNHALQRLSDHLGDTHLATPDDLERAGWGDTPVFRAMLAQTDRLVGAAMYVPVFSTRIGGAGVYVSDLWVAPEQRGQHMGQRLLATVLEDAANVWGAMFLKLEVDQGNPDARRFYDRLGFIPAKNQTAMILDQAGCTALRGKP
ncbi:GNAT family N-acetyltransferase [Sedimentitalea nanhaiensis]|uniref:Ribosomal protein S18 acetylase RimI n=1 Tax=Sedimentitalea nanhaiensis TaxID=999627 RepID=A0A1I7E8C8_9RHOB|nr:GNAT family N-acetyltransferase [Sedimentitalea nanhaiensis]SFU20226.1 Ribosomal protein S18 acetylase RimI [Sedimentitalea nanhaiensis]